jgi:hypothetical protein
MFILIYLINSVVVYLLLLRTKYILIFYKCFSELSITKFILVDDILSKVNGIG